MDNKTSTNHENGNDANRLLVEVQNPLTEEEQEIMKLIVKAHNNFVKLERVHPMEVQEWVTAIHSLQSIISHRCLRRHFPKYFS